MDKFKIIGKSRIAGEVTISGSKNAALPLLAAMLLPNDETILHNVPTLKDTETLIKLIAGTGVNIKRRQYRHRRFSYCDRLLRAL